MGFAPYDDNGFTNLLGARLRLGDVRLDLSHMMITERGGFRRTDEARAGVSFERVLAEAGPFRVTGETGAALALSGPLGGMELQDWMHAHVFRGRRLDGSGMGQLQNITPKVVRTGIVFSAGARFDVAPAPWLTLGSSVRASLALGETGLSSLSADVHARLDVPITSWLGVDASASVAVNALHTRDAWLTLPGGYDTRAPFVSTSLSAGLSVGPVRAGFQVDGNVGGSGANMGLATLGVRF